MTTKALFLRALLGLGALPVAQARNPICPSGTYIADPSAHVWADGRLYVYGSLDETPTDYCSHRYHVLWTADLKTWSLTENAFASQGPGDGVPYSDARLYAPDCQYFDGIYHLYYCLSGGPAVEGVATSKSPLGPFTDGRIIDTGAYNEIDPAVFVDDDGRAYYVWGQFTGKIARLKSNHVEIDQGTVREVVNEKEHYFHEGGYLVKRKGIYYFVYANIARAGRPTCIGYATSRSVFGPYAYGGVIVDNQSCDPGNWNNHGSLVEYQGRWYVFYHRATHGNYAMRKACVEPISFRDDGSIPEVEMTTQGAEAPLPAGERLEAEAACLLHGQARVEAFGPHEEMLAWLHDGDRAAYKYLDFGDGQDSVTIRVAPGPDAGRIEVALDQPWHETIGAIDVPGGDDGKVWTTSSTSIKHTTGVHAVWLRFRGKGERLYRVDWMQFAPKRQDSPH